MSNPKPLEIAEAQCRLKLGPRHNPPLSDDAVLTVGYHSGGDKSVLLSRARATELHEWLGTWLERGWDGVKQEAGESTADVIDHFRQIAIRYQLDRDHARTDAAREVDAALALIPAELRTVELAKVAAAQSEVWHRRQARIDGLERFRLAIVMLAHDLSGARGLTVEQALKALDKTVDKYNHPKVDDAKLPTTDAPVYDMRQLDLFETMEAAA